MNAYVFSNVLLCFVINFHLLHPAQPCQWQPYRTVDEGQYPLGIFIFRVQRSTEICVKNNTIYNFQTSRNFVRPDTNDWRCQMTNSFGVCSGSCVSKPVTFSISCELTTEDIPPVTSSFNYNNKNCDKAYWTSWSQVTNCSNSRSRVFTRIAKDCDQIPFPSTYHINGYLKKKEEPCQPLWSEWVTVFCNLTNNTMKEQVRTRKCLYGDGSETNNTRLCSNQSAIITEKKCLYATTMQTVHQITRRTCENTNQINFLLIVISVVLALMLIISIVFFVIAWKRKVQIIKTTAQREPHYVIVDRKFDLKNKTKVLSNVSVNFQDREGVEDHYRRSGDEEGLCENGTKVAE